MGNKISSSRPVIDERYARPQGLHMKKEIDEKKLRKLILEYKLAPCYPGNEEYAFDLEECPICYLYYPSLNRSRCCMKSICTECFLQMKPSLATDPTQCPFCKTSNFEVEYRGEKTKEEKSLEQVEEQKVIEAQIRIRLQELQGEAERMKKKHDINSPSRIMVTGDIDYDDMHSIASSAACSNCTRQTNDFSSLQASSSVLASPRPSPVQNRNDSFDLDLEDIMVMEAIWLSIQDQGSQGNPASFGSSLTGSSFSEESYNYQEIAALRSSPVGLAYAAEALAEQRRMLTESAANVVGNDVAVFEMIQQPGNIPARNARFVPNNPPGQQRIAMSPDNGTVTREDIGEHSIDHWSEAADPGTSSADSNAMVDAVATAITLPQGVDMAPGQLIPDSFEDQMLMAMAMSLVEARGRTESEGHSWLQRPDPL